MNIYLYAKSDTDISCFEDIIDILKDSAGEINIVLENRRAFHEYEKIIRKLSQDDVLVICDIKDIGNNEAAIVNRLEWFVKKEIPLVISTVPSTYEYGILQPMNKAVLDTLIQSITMNDSHLTEKVLRLV